MFPGQPADPYAAQLAILMNRGARQHGLVCLPTGSSRGRSGFLDREFRRGIGIKALI